jgi:hypothetical protein
MPNPTCGQKDMRGGTSWTPFISYSLTHWCNLLGYEVSVPQVATVMDREAGTARYIAYRKLGLSYQIFKLFRKFSLALQIFNILTVAEESLLTLAHR